MAESIFTKIIKGEIPAYKIYEDDKTLAFLDIHPVQLGHTLVIPKIEIDQLWDLPENYYLALMYSCKKVALRLREVLGVKRVGVKVVGVDVPHTHVQLIPFNDSKEYLAVPDMDNQADANELKILSERLRF